LTKVISKSRLQGSFRYLVTARPGGQGGTVFPLRGMGRSPSICLQKYETTKLFSYLYMNVGKIFPTWKGDFYGKFRLDTARTRGTSTHQK
jgi:hypothetical protein